MPDLSDLNGVHLDICDSCLQLDQLASNPGTEECPVSTVCACASSPDIPGIPDNTASSPWLVDVRYVYVTVSRSYSVNNGDFMQDLDEAVSYLEQLGCAAMMLEPEQRASLK